MRLFSTRHRAVSDGPYPLERLSRQPLGAGGQQRTPTATPLDGSEARDDSIIHAMNEYLAMLDAIREGLVNRSEADIPSDLGDRSAHLKAFGYFNDAAMVGICSLPDEARLVAPLRNPGIDRLAHDLRTRQTRTLAAGIDLIMADLRESMEAPPTSVTSHRFAVVFAFEQHRPARADEAGSDWILGAERHRAALLAMETAAVIANYLRTLGHASRAHSATSADVDLAQLAVAAGLAFDETEGEGDDVVMPWLGTRYGLAAVTTTLELAADAPLSPRAEQPWTSRSGPSWWLGVGTRKGALNQDPYARRRYVDGAYPFESLKRVDTPTTFIDEANVPRVPKRTDLFARAQFGDMGAAVQAQAKGGRYVSKSAPSQAQRRALGAFVLLQDGPPADTRAPDTNDPQRNADNVKAASYFLGLDAVGISRCPAWTWYSHDATGAAIDPPHDQAISMVVDQGYETMEGASGDDWISVAQSMRAYLRFSLLGGVIANHLRRLGYSAKAHTVIDGEVLQPPLLLLSGLGEVSRIGEVILNPYLGPRLKSGVVTTDMPLAHDKPIDFGLQHFCEHCNKCARECPSGAITAGPKLMFNGYEIWKSDSQKCATYRVTTEGGAMCGRCMKTCPWNLEGLFAEAPFRWAASNIPQAAPLLARLDDKLGNGTLNDTKKWWWDLELKIDGAYRPTDAPVNRRDLQPDLDVRYEDQTLAVYPAPLAPHPWPYPDPMDREAGIDAYRAMVSAAEYRRLLERGEIDSVAHRYTVPGEAPVLRLEVAEVDAMTDTTRRYVLRPLDGNMLPEWTAGAHLDVVVAPEFLRQYSMCGDPADRSCYEIAVLREDAGRGGSALLTRIFNEGRKVFVSRPVNHFELVENAMKTWLMAGGIGVTPMIAFAHRLHALGADFELHYSASRAAEAAFVQHLRAMPWRDRVHFHFSDSGQRADLDALLTHYEPGHHVYTCGPDRYMDAVMAAAQAAGFPEDARHLEYFAVPEQPEYENHPFTLRLARSGKTLDVAANESATDALARVGVHVDVKCSDGLCGVCRCDVIEGDVEHRDFVLSAKQRESAMILCQSRASAPDATLTIDL